MTCFWSTSARHGAHYGDETQERETVNQARCPLQGRDSGKRNSQPGMVPTAETRLRKEKQSTRHGAHCGDETQGRGTIISHIRCPLLWRNTRRRRHSESCRAPFLSERAWASRLAQKLRHSLAESQFDLVARVVCGLRDSGPNWPWGWRGLGGVSKEGATPEGSSPPSAGSRSPPTPDTRTHSPGLLHCPGSSARLTRALFPLSCLRWD